MGGVGRSSTETVCGAKRQGISRKIFALTKYKTFGFAEGYSANSNLFLLVLEKQSFSWPWLQSNGLLLVQLETICQHQERTESASLTRWRGPPLVGDRVHWEEPHSAQFATNCGSSPVGRPPTEGPPTPGGLDAGPY